MCWCKSVELFQQTKSLFSNKKNSSKKFNSYRAHFNMKIRQKCHKKVKIGGKVRRLFHDTLGGTESDKNAHPNIQSKSA